jgi:taurine dioxygenase
MQVTRLTSTIGAEISAVDLRALSDAERREIGAQLDTYTVLLFRGQHLDLAAQCAFAETFGPLEPLQSAKFIGKDPVLVLDKLVKGRDQRRPTEQWIEFDGWHTDSSFTEYVPRAAVLRAEVIPPIGGMTCWTNVCAAYEALSPTLREWLKTLRAVHAYPDGYREGIGVDKLPQEQQDKFDAQFCPRAQPVVFRHPRSGRCGLFVNPSYTTHIEGLAAKESRALLSFLFTHMTSAEFVYRHRWEEGDILVWDELATLHLAPDASDYAPHPRRVVRVTAGKETPVPA